MYVNAFGNGGIEREREREREEKNDVVFDRRSNLCTKASFIKRYEKRKEILIGGLVCSLTNGGRFLTA